MRCIVTRVRPGVESVLPKDEFNHILIYKRPSSALHAQLSSTEPRYSASSTTCLFSRTVLPRVLSRCEGARARARAPARIEHTRMNLIHSN